MKNFMNLKRITSLLSDYRQENPFLKITDDLFEEIYSLLKKIPICPSCRVNKITINPAIDIVEDEQNFKVEVEMPGLNEENIQVSFNGRILCVKGIKKASHKNKDKNYVSREIEYGYYEKNILLPDYVAVDKAHASFKKGMLWVSFPKKFDAEKRYHQIKVERAHEKEEYGI